MIKLITGKKGTGKTKVLIDMINDVWDCSHMTIFVHDMNIIIIFF